MRGRYLFIRNPDDAQVQNEAEQLYQRALDLDPQFTLAGFGQFFVLSRRQRSGGMNYQEGAVQMRKLADSLIAMDPQLPESYVALARTALVEMRWSESEAALRQALELSPGNINASVALAGLLQILNRVNEGLEYALKALNRDPLSLQALYTVANGYGLLGRCEESEDLAQRAMSLVPGASRFHAGLANCWMFQHQDYMKAAGMFEKEPIGFLRRTGLAVVYNKLGQQDRAQQSLDELVAQNGEGASYQYAQIYAQWGEKEKALDALEQAWEIGDTGFVLINMDEHLRPLADEPRFIALLEKWRDPSKR